MLKVLFAESVPEQGYPLLDAPYTVLGGYQPSPGIIVVLTPRPAEVALEFPWGYMKQGREAVGALRDKDVMHMSLQGELRVNQQLLDTYQMNPNAGFYHVGDPPFIWQTAVSAGDVYPIGGDYSHMWGHEAFQVNTVRTIGSWIIVSHALTFAPVYAEHRFFTGTQTLGSGGMFYKTEMYQVRDGVLYTGPSYSHTSAEFSAGTSNYATNATGLERYLEEIQPQASELRYPVDLHFQGPFFTPEQIEGIINDGLRGLDTGTFTRMFVDTPQDVDEWGELALDCSEQLQHVDGNMLMLVFDVANWREMIFNLKALSRAPRWKQYILDRAVRSGFVTDRRTRKLVKNGKVSVRSVLKTKTYRINKSVANMFLYEQYAVSTCLSDLTALAEGVARLIAANVPRRLHSRSRRAYGPYGHAITRERVLTVETDTYPRDVTGRLQEAIGWLKRMGLYPALRNLHDLLKYSFVLEWFVRFGGFLSSVDDYLNLENYFPVKEVILSEKYEYLVQAYEFFPTLGNYDPITVVKYDRWIQFELPMPNIALRMGSGLNLLRSAQATALTSQRLRR